MLFSMLFLYFCIGRFYFIVLQDKAREALDIFDELVEIEIGIIIPYVKPLVEFCMQVMVIIKGTRII